MATVPGVVQAYTLPLASNQRLDFYWNPPLNDGGSPILSYVIEARTVPGGSLITNNTFGPNEQYGFLSGLTNNVMYYCSIYATNAIGSGPSADFRPFSPGTNVPSIPTSLGVSTNLTTYTSAIAQWGAPVSDGGNTIFWYSVVAQPVDTTVSTVRVSANGQTQSNIVLNNLTFNKTYNLSVNAVNTVGYSPTRTQTFRTATDNVYITGTYNGTLSNYNSGSAIPFSTLSTSFGVDSFLVKYNADGSNLNYRWGARISGTVAGGNREQSQEVAYDGSNGIYVTGYYSAGTTIFYNANGSAFSNTLPLSGPQNAFHAKYNTDGVVQWATRSIGTANVQGESITCDTLGNAYSFGYYNSVLSNYNSDNTLFSTLAFSGVNDAYLIKFNTLGMIQWNTRIGGGAADLSFSAKADGSNAIYVTGRYAGALTSFNRDGTAFSNVLVNSGGADTFITKYNADGFVQWATRIAGSGGDEGYGVTTDVLGNVFVTGPFGSALLSNFNADNTPFSNVLTNPGGQDIFLTKYNSNGFVQWTTRIAGNTLNANDTSYSVATDSNGAVYVTGFYTSAQLISYSANSNPFSPALTNFGNADVFLVKYDLNGNVEWNTSITSGSGSVADIGFSVAVDGSNVYLTGQYAATATIRNKDGTSNSSLGSTGNENIFIVEYDLNGNVVNSTRMGTQAGGGAIGYSIAYGAR
jgi:hypothetical protein